MKLNSLPRCNAQCLYPPPQGKQAKFEWAARAIQHYDLQNRTMKIIADGPWFISENHQTRDLQTNALPTHKICQCQTEQRATHHIQKGISSPKRCSTTMKLWSPIWLQLLNLVKQSTYNPWIDVPSNGRRSIGSKDAYVFSLVFILNFAVFRLPYFIAFWYLSLES